MKIVISRDVVFDEEGTWSWNENGVKQNIPADFDDEEKGQQPMENEQEQEAAQNDPIVDQGPLAAESQRPQRVRTRPAWMTDYEVTGVDQGDDPLTHFALFSDCDPTTFEVAVKESKWRKAMDAEIAAIKRNNTWELHDLPKGQKTIGVKWVYKTKLKENSDVDKHKARLVAKGYKQEFGVDYKEVFAPVARHYTIRLVIALVAQNSWPIFQLDVKLAFLLGDLKEKVFIDQPPGYMKLGNEHKVYKLKKALYGLKQPPRAWYNRIETYFLKEGYNKCLYEHTLFIKIEDGGKMLIVSLYVDDLIYTGNNTAMFESFYQCYQSQVQLNHLMASDSFVQPAIPHFDGHYDHWSMLMENILRFKEYWAVVVSGVAEPTEGVVQTDAQKTELEELKLKDLKAKNYLFQAIDCSILETILARTPPSIFGIPGRSTKVQQGLGGSSFKHFVLPGSLEKFSAWLQSKAEDVILFIVVKDYTLSSLS
jgi:hypothetical protein